RGEVHPRSGERTILRRATPFLPDPAVASLPEHIEFPTTGGLTAHGNFYRPPSRPFRGPDGELPPLIVTSHGGPTSSAFSGWATGMQLFTSPGLFGADVGYGGPTRSTKR